MMKILSLALLLLPVSLFAIDCPQYVEMSVSPDSELESANRFGAYPQVDDLDFDRRVGAATQAAQSIGLLPNGMQPLVPEVVYFYSSLRVVFQLANVRKSGKCEFVVTSVEDLIPSWFEIGLSEPATRVAEAEDYRWDQARLLVGGSSSGVSFSLMFPSSSFEAKDSVYQSRGGFRERGLKHDPFISTEDTVARLKPIDGPQFVDAYYWRRNENFQIGELNPTHQWTAFVDIQVQFYFQESDMGLDLDRSAHQAAVDEQNRLDQIEIEEAWQVVVKRFRKLTGFDLNETSVDDIDLVKAAERENAEDYPFLKAFKRSPAHLSLLVSLFNSPMDRRMKRGVSLADLQRRSQNLQDESIFSYLPVIELAHQKIQSWEELAEANLPED